jgi:hypothetical protein
MPYARGRAEALAKALRDEDKVKALMSGMAEMTEPYGTAASLSRIYEGEADAFDYLAAVPVLGLPARAVKGMNRMNDIVRKLDENPYAELKDSDWDALNKADDYASMARSSRFMDLPQADQEGIESLMKAHGYPRDTAARIYYGLLPMDDASRMARAKDQGFDTSEVVYRGVNDPYKQNTGRTFSTDNPGVAGTYVENPQDIMDTYPTSGMGFKEGMDQVDKMSPAIYPMYRRPGMELDVDPGLNVRDGSAMNLEEPTQWSSIPTESLPEEVALRRLEPMSTDDVANFAERADYDSVRFQDIEDLGPNDWGEGMVSGIDPEAGDVVEQSATIYSNKPTDLRSVRAAFDPEAKDPTNIMAGIAGLSTTALMAELLRRQKDEEEAL